MTTSSKLSKSVFSVSAATSIDYVLQFILPIVIARVLTPDDFAGYRMVWVVVGTIMAFATLNIPQSLSYFLPRLDEEEKKAIIYASIWILICLAVVSSIIVNPWHPLLPTDWVGVEGGYWFYPVFVFVWVLAALVDWLPVGDGRAIFQAKTILFLSFFRVLAVAGTAWFSHALEPVLQALLLFAVIKLCLLVYYVLRFYKCQFVWSSKSIKEILRYSFPFGAASGLFLVRSQLELWMMAALNNPKDFAAFTLGAVGVSILGLLRGTVSNVIFPDLNAFHASGEIDKVAELNSKATSTVAFMIFPSASFLWVFADQIVEIVFTEKYLAAADVMRILLITAIPQIFEGTSLLRLCGLGYMAIRIDTVMLPIVIVVSYVGFEIIGLPGGAMGGVTALFLGNAWAVWTGGKKLKLGIHQLYDIHALLMLLIVSILSGFVAWYGIAMISVDNIYLFLVMGGVIFTFSYLILSYVMRTIPEPIVNFCIHFMNSHLKKRFFGR